MSRKVGIRRRNRRVALGDMLSLITVYNRDITAPVAGSFDFSETFSNGVTVKAMVETVENVEFFDGTNLKRAITHHFYIRLRSVTVDHNSQIVWDGRRFEVLDTQNLDDRNEFMMVRAKLSGDLDLATNQ